MSKSSMINNIFSIIDKDTVKVLNYRYHLTPTPLGMRYFNVFERRQDLDGAYAAVIPKWVGSLLEGEGVYINGDGETSRDFTYIDNVIQMNLLVGTTDNTESFGEAFNVEVGGRNTLNELYKIINDNLVEQFKIYNLKFIIPEDPVYRDFRAGDIRHSNANISKAQNFVGYAPTHDIYQGIEEVIEWYIENTNKGRN